MYRVHQQIMWFPVVKRTLGTRIRSFEFADDCPGSFLELFERFFLCFFLFTHPVLFSFPARLAQASTRTKVHRPSGSSSAPIKARISNSGNTADNGAPARCSGVEPLIPTPKS